MYIRRGAARRHEGLFQVDIVIPAKAGIQFSHAVDVRAFGLHDNPQGTPKASGVCHLSYLKGDLLECSCLLTRPRCDQGAPRLKFTVTCVSTSTGSPFSNVGRYLHCWTASQAARIKSG